MTKRSLMSCIRVIVGVIIAGACPLATEAGVSYNDPAGGWRYIYQGTLNPGVGGLPAGFGVPGDTQALDGTWEHHQSDKWDGTGPGNIAMGTPGNAPGGLGVYTEGSTNYFRIQDAGNPEAHGFPQGTAPQNNNRRVYFGHNVNQDFTAQDPLPDQRILNNGITLSFRMRVPNSGVLDDAYPVDASNLPLPTEPWIDPSLVTNPNGNGRGSIMTNGRGFINVVQNVPLPFGDDTDNLIGFSMPTSTDIARYVNAGGTGSITSAASGGLIMNNRIGSSPSPLIDSTSAGVLNMVPIPDSDLSQWHEFWITIVGGGSGTHIVNVYMDGALTAMPFNVTSASGNNAAYANSNAPYIEFGFSDSAGMGAYDVDFLAYKLGVILPTAAPVEDADFDDDGDVDGADFLTWQRGLGIGTTNATGDANGSNSVDATDLAIWKSQFGSATVAVGAIPEPSAFALALGAAALVGTTLRRRVQS